MKLKIVRLTGIEHNRDQVIETELIQQPEVSKMNQIITLQNSFCYVFLWLAKIAFYRGKLLNKSCSL